MGVYVIYTKLYIFAAYALHALLLVGVAHAFGTVRHAFAMKCEKCEEGKVYNLVLECQLL